MSAKQLYLKHSSAQTPPYFLTTNENGDTPSTSADCNDGQFRIINTTGDSLIVEASASVSSSGACETCRAGSLSPASSPGDKLTFALLDSSTSLQVTVTVSGGAPVDLAPIGITHSCSLITIKEDGTISSQSTLLANGAGGEQPAVFCSSGNVRMTNDYSSAVTVSWSGGTTTEGSQSIEARTGPVSLAVGDSSALSVSGTPQSATLTIVHQDLSSVQLHDWAGSTPTQPAIGVDTKVLTADYNEQTLEWSITINNYSVESLTVAYGKTTSQQYAAGSSNVFTFTPDIPTGETEPNQIQPVSITGLAQQARNGRLDFDDPWVLVKHGPCKCS